MIKYKLKCQSSYCTEQKGFDGWFQNIETFENQLDSGLINCPLCGSENVSKLLTTPSLNKIQNTNKKITKNKIHKNAFGNEKLENITTILRSIKNEIKKNSSFVGDDFVNQARSMNQGPTASPPSRIVAHGGFLAPPRVRPHPFPRHPWFACTGDEFILGAIAIRCFL